VHSQPNSERPLGETHRRNTRIKTSALIVTIPFLMAASAVKTGKFTYVNTLRPYEKSGSSGLAMKGIRHGDAEFAEGVCSG
jgi:hypothetical protein